jgi:hypothetical protein
MKVIDKSPKLLSPPPSTETPSTSAAPVTPSTTAPKPPSQSGLAPKPEPPKPEARKPEMEIRVEYGRWQYKSAVMAVNSDPTEPFGEQGWELVSVVPLPHDPSQACFHFKRRR